MEAAAGGAGTLDDTSNLAKRLPSFGAVTRTISPYLGYTATVLSGAVVARDITNGRYLDAGFAAADTAIAWALADLGPVGIGLDAALAAGGGTKASAQGAAGIACILGGG